MSTLGDFELACLVAVARLREEAYGLSVREEVSAIRSHDYSIGAVYATLQRLEEKKFLTSSMTDPLPVRGGRSRREYRVTAAGKKALREAQESAARLWTVPLSRLRTT